MLLPIVLSLVASSLALPAFELHTPTDALVNNNEIAEIIEYLPSSNERQEEEKRILEEKQRVIEEEKRIIEEEKKIEEANKVIEEENKIIEKEEKKILDEAEKRLIEEEKRLIEEENIMEEEQKVKVVLSPVPSPPELPPVDTTMLSNFLKAGKLDEAEKRLIEEEKRLIEEENIMEEEQKVKVVLSPVPSPPELPPVDTTMLSNFLKAGKLEKLSQMSNSPRLIKNITVTL